MVDLTARCDILVVKDIILIRQELSVAHPLPYRVSRRAGLIGPAAPRVISYPRPIARPVLVDLGPDRQPLAWTSRDQHSPAKYGLGWGFIGALTLTAFLSHCAHPVMVLWRWFGGG